jgi:hypothetical protein
LICPKCGENNSNSFRFCGMCGTLLEARRPAGATPVPDDSLATAAKTAVPKITSPKTTNAPTAPQAFAFDNTDWTASKQVPPISGPSMLGLNPPDANPTGSNQSRSNQPRPNQPDMDALREGAFSGLGSFVEADQPKTGGRRLLLLVALLAALGGAAWWTYSYLGDSGTRKPSAVPASVTNSPSSTGNDKPSNSAAAPDGTPAPDAGSSQVPAPQNQLPESPTEKAPASHDALDQAASSEAKPAAKPALVKPRVEPAAKGSAKRESSATSVKASKLPEPAAADAGTAEFRRGEAYLYGRGVPENCDEAVKNLKAASAKSNAKARSAFGTMYATGHCAPRDLPTSYLWFAMALRVDPNNQILEKDLSAIWNQMTPPERQLATRMKQ